MVLRRSRPTRAWSERAVTRTLALALARTLALALTQILTLTLTLTLITLTLTSTLALALTSRPAVAQAIEWQAAGNWSHQQPVHGRSELRGLLAPYAYA